MVKLPFDHIELFTFNLARLLSDEMDGNFSVTPEKEKTLTRLQVNSSCSNGQHVNYYVGDAKVDKAICIYIRN